MDSPRSSIATWVHSLHATSTLKQEGTYLILATTVGDEIVACGRFPTALFDAYYSLFKTYSAKKRIETDLDPKTEDQV